MNGVGEDWEVVYVNDGSRDSSLDLLRGLQAGDPHVVVANLSRNWGHMGAITAGMQTARGDAVIIMDGDFQDPPDVLPELISSWRGGAQVVIAARRSRQESRKLLAWLFPMFYKVLGALSDYPIPLNAGIFGLMDRQALDAVLALREKNRYLPGLRSWVGYRHSVVFYDRQDRLGGEGKLSFISRIKYAMDAITSFSYKPLRLCFAMSGLCLTVAVLLGICTPFAGTSVGAVGLGVAASVFVVGSILMLCLGILGEYLGRVYDEVRDRPLSLINEVFYSDAAAAHGTDELAEEHRARILRIA